MEGLHACTKEVYRTKREHIVGGYVSEGERVGGILQDLGMQHVGGVVLV